MLEGLFKLWCVIVKRTLQSTKKEISLKITMSIFWKLLNSSINSAKDETRQGKSDIWQKIKNKFWSKKCRQMTTKIAKKRENHQPTQSVEIKSACKFHRGVFFRDFVLKNHVAIWRRKHVFNLYVLKLSSDGLCQTW